jgi:trehalose 6-phosphate synthase
MSGRPEVEGPSPESDSGSIDLPWTEDRLREFVRARLGDRKLVVVSNREPYVHVQAEGGIACLQPASGVTVALDPILKACGGTWVAHGSGSADQEMSDEKGRTPVPPGDPRYTLRRVWLTKEEEEGYYYGFSNRALWPLCHVAYTRPEFRREHWEAYGAVNRRFAEAVLEEIGGKPAFVFIQDYHFALLPRMLRENAPNALIAQFWHIPWPNPEAFRVCPWKQEILQGLLGNHLLAFHIQYHCNNFMDTADRELEARLDRERFVISRGEQATRVQPVPISIDFEGFSARADSPETEVEMQRLRRRFRLPGKRVALGVDRLDYTKGIPERLRAVDRFLTRNPRHREKFVFLQIGVPSRIHIEEYKRLGDEVESLVDEINWRHKSGCWVPILYLQEHVDRDLLPAYYRMADVCLVTSLHDGMNLVAKEYVASRSDLRGTLLLSPFTGAARELLEAFHVNPFAVDDMADTLARVLDLPVEEQEARMRRLRERVREANVFRWAAKIVDETVRTL